MILPRWKDPHRKRRDISFLNPDFCRYYDLDMTDFEHLVIKLKNGEQLTELENDRYGLYILTMCLIVMEGPKFKNKPNYEKEEILEQQYFEMLPGLRLFNPEKGKLYSYAYRIGYTSACHYYTGKADAFRKEQEIKEHCEEEYLLYMDETLSHKVNTNDSRN